MALPKEGITEQLTKAIADYLQKNIPEVGQVLFEWPNANQQISYPAISIITQDAKFLNQPSWDESITDPDDNNRLKVVQVHGDYDVKLQLDIWALNRKQRAQVYESVFLNINGVINKCGLNLVMPGYFGQIASYTLTGFQFQDEEISAQRREWRATLAILATCKAIVEHKEYAIVETETTFAISEYEKP